MVNITTVSVWKDGVSKSADKFGLRVIGDDLATNALFYYELLQTDDEVLITGNLIMEGSEYAAWGTSTDINAEAYAWAATELNLTII